MTTLKIHPTVIIESGAKIDDSVKIGPYSIIGEKCCYQIRNRNWISCGNYR